MKTKIAIEMALVLSGRFALPGMFLTIHGVDEYGMAKVEQVQNHDWPALEAEAKRILADGNA